MESISFVNEFRQKLLELFFRNVTFANLLTVCIRKIPTSSKRAINKKKNVFDRHRVSVAYLQTVSL